MSTIKDGGPAFPTQNEGQIGTTKWHFQGMSLRDYIAIHASEQDILRQAEVIRSAQMSAGGMGILDFDWSTTARYMHADAMIRAREVTA